MSGDGNLAETVVIFLKMNKHLKMDQTQIQSSYNLNFYYRKN